MACGVGRLVVWPYNVLFELCLAAAAGWILAVLEHSIAPTIDRCECVAAVVVSGSVLEVCGRVWC